uniref:C2H2-type domain-containing protein n=1 Tax=Ananas comosus var. bracteatus TaxID=296719 RepID=A0A6V7P4K7_ANACO|nr:unnamed protein product [Ananas comosus var. bracteatus]
MEFWGVEVKPGETVKCDPGDDKYLHLSQASLGETKKDRGSESVPIYVKFNDQKLVLGTLSTDKVPQISYDLVFEKEFELSNSSKNASVYFLGYKTPSDFGDTDSEDEDIPLGLSSNGKPMVKEEEVKPAAAKNNTAKADASAAKTKVKIEEPNKASSKQEADDEDDDDESEEDASDDEDGDEDMLEGEEDSDDEDDSDSSDEEEEETTPKKAESKKRPAEPASKSGKKAKLASPAVGQKTGGDGKVGGHVATPHPAKLVGKTPASNKQQQTPKSVGSVTCKSCSKKFNSENALQAHTKAKHSSGK